jgi:hypothetical protein
MERGGYMCGGFRKHGMKRFMSFLEYSKAYMEHFDVSTSVWTNNFFY